jgi:hypothetical protein
LHGNLLGVYVHESLVYIMPIVNTSCRSGNAKKLFN